MTIEGIIWYLFLIDAIVVNVIVLFFKKWYIKKGFNKILPLYFLWSLVYLFLVLWVGFALYRLRIIP